MNALTVRDLHAGYGAIKVLHGVNVEVSKGGATAVLGANGAGKTTLLRAICGQISRRGTVELEGEPIDKLDTADIARRGVAHVPQGRGTFATLTTEENLRLGAHTRRKSGKIQQDYALVYEYFPRLYERREQQAGTLSGGEQQMLAIGRALLQRPKVLLVDELSMGLAPVVVESILAVLRDVATTERTAVMLVEQHVRLALGIADRAVVLVHGQVSLEDDAAVLSKDVGRIERAYLGHIGSVG